MYAQKYLLVVCIWLATLASSKPIMISFGTNKGPITPKEIVPSIQPRTISLRDPAPVREDREDIPNPVQYRPPVPHQYRSKIYAIRPPPNLILGTPLDQKYTPSLQKYNVHRKQYARNLGLADTGPHVFEKQEYETYESKKKTTLRPSARYNKQEYYDPQGKYVPQIGIIYSSGVRYYVPQIAYYYQGKQNGENGVEENSVYDKDDQKYYQQ